MSLKIGILASTKGSDMQAIIDAIETGSLDAEIVLVLSDNRHSGALERARRHGIEAVHLDPTEYKRKERFDAEVCRKMQEKEAALVLLIGYNRIVRRPLLDAYKGKILNIHPSLLPEFAGEWDVNVHEQVLAQEREETGCTLHIVTEEVDAGPIIKQKRVKVLYGDTVESLKARVQAAEQEVILTTLQEWSSGGMGDE